MELFDGHVLRTLHVLGAGEVHVAHHLGDGLICAVVVRAWKLPYLNINHHTYGPIPPEILTELTAALSPGGLYERAMRLGFEHI